MRFRFQVQALILQQHQDAAVKEGSRWAMRAYKPSWRAAALCLKRAVLAAVACNQTETTISLLLALVMMRTRQTYIGSRRRHLLLEHFRLDLVASVTRLIAGTAALTPSRGGEARCKHLRGAACKVQVVVTEVVHADGEPVALALHRRNCSRRPAPSHVVLSLPSLPHLQQPVIVELAATQIFGGDVE